MSPHQGRAHEQAGGKEKPAIDWDVDDLLRWIKDERPALLDDDKSRKLREADVSGEVFLGFRGNKDFFQHDCKLPPGTAFVLAKLARNLAGQEENKKGLQDQDVEMSDVANIERPHITSARFIDLLRIANGGLLKLESELPINNRKRKASPFDDTLRQIAENAKQIHIENINIIGRWNKDTLSDPKTVADLVFPYIGPVKPKRFAVKNSRWQFAGREVFRTLIDDVDYMRQSEALNALWVYGTRGYGKSHLLAALVCYLSARGDNVVYIPDCRLFTEDPEFNLRRALLFAWTDDKTQEEILSLTGRDDLTRFLRQKTPLFVIDQTNGFVERDVSPLYKHKQDVKIWLTQACTNSKAIYSTSANNSSFHEIAQTQNNFMRRNLFGGYTQVEMESWWQRHPDLQVALSAQEEFKQALKEQAKQSQWENRWQDFRQLKLKQFKKSKKIKGRLTKKQSEDFEDFVSKQFEEAEATEPDKTTNGPTSNRRAEHEHLKLEQFKQDQKAELEQLTGRIPLLLEMSISGSEFHLDNDGSRELFCLARGFVRDIRQKYDNEWDDYRNFVEGCLVREQVDPSLLHDYLIDHRFFYEDEGIGYCVCDIAAHAVTTELLRSQAPFSVSRFLTSITNYKNNASVSRFIFETAILRCIALDRLSVDTNLDRKMSEVVTFSQDVPVITGLKFDLPVL